MPSVRPNMQVEFKNRKYRKVGNSSKRLSESIKFVKWQFGIQIVWPVRQVLNGEFSAQLQCKWFGDGSLWTAPTSIALIQYPFRMPSRQNPINPVKRDIQPA